jgi:hypothetical protein
MIDILKADPANEQAMQLLTGLYASEPRKAEEFKAAVRGHIAKNKSSAAGHAPSGRNTLRNDDHALHPDLALDAAKAAYDASKQSWAIESMPRRLYQIGNLDRAISLQQEAVSAPRRTIAPA